MKKLLLGLMILVLSSLLKAEGFYLGLGAGLVNSEMKITNSSSETISSQERNALVLTFGTYHTEDTLFTLEYKLLETDSSETGTILTAAHKMFWGPDSDFTFFSGTHISYNQSQITGRQAWGYSKDTLDTDYTALYFDLGFSYEFVDDMVLYVSYGIPLLHMSTEDKATLNSVEYTYTMSPVTSSAFASLGYNF